MAGEVSPPLDAQRIRFSEVYFSKLIKRDSTIMLDFRSLNKLVMTWHLWDS